MKYSLLVALSVLTLWTPFSLGGDWKAGVSRVRITPQEPVFLSGYASRDHPSEGVLADLWLTVLALEDSLGGRALLVTADLIGFRGEMTEQICRRITEQTGLQRSRILLNASHTHTGPTPLLEWSPDSAMPEGEGKKLVAYTQRLQDQVVSAALEALGRLQSARLELGVGVAPFVMNRRETTPRGVVLGFNPRGPVDRSVPVLAVRSEEGALRAVVFGAACHNTTLTGQHYEISGDYSGFAQLQLQEMFPGVPSLFVTGCAGDANPHPRGSAEFARAHGLTLAEEVRRVLAQKLQAVGGPLRTAFEWVDLPLQEPPPRSELESMSRQGGWEAFVGSRLLAALDRGDQLPRHYRAPLAIWQFGSDLTLVGLPGEVVVDYVYRIEEALGPMGLWVAGYCNDVFGYLPSARVLREGGYETRGLYSGGIGRFAPEVEAVVVEKVRQMGQSLRKRP